MNKTPDLSSEGLVGALLARIAAAPEDIVLLDALPGTGKTRLLGAAHQAQTGRMVADLSPRAAQFAPGPGRWLIAGRQAQIEGAARRRIYGQMRVIGNDGLFLSPAECLHFDRSAGWPVIEAQLSREPDAERLVIAYLSETLNDQPPELRDLMHALAGSGRGLPESELTAEERDWLDWLGPLVHQTDGRWHIVEQGLSRLMACAAASGPVSERVATLMGHTTSPECGILALIGVGNRRAARNNLVSHGGIYFGHLHGSAAAAKVVTAFGGDPDPHIVGLAVMTALKSGDTERAGWLLTQADGPALVDLTRRPAALDKVAPALVFCRLYLSIMRGDTVRAGLLEEASELLARIGPDQALMRGAIYNTVLEIHIRAGRYGEARDTAARALHNYIRADAPYLQFFVHLHLALIDLSQGQPAMAGRHLPKAGAALARTLFASPQDHRFVRLLAGVAAYERGDPDPLAAFCRESGPDLIAGELWSSLAGLALNHGCEALRLTDGEAAAQRFIDNWQMQIWRTRRFQVAIRQREIAVLQAERRWHRAGVALREMATRIGRIWMQGARRDLEDLRDGEDIAQAMLWLRQLCFETPRASDLPMRLVALNENPRLSVRQRTALTLWRAWVERRRGQVTQARRYLDEALREAAQRDCVAPILEERGFVLPLLDDKRVMVGNITTAPVPRNLRRGAVADFGPGLLTRQEWRVLLLLGEGCSNKDIARNMDLSLPTVKFHLRNLFRKLNVSDRKAAAECAHRLGQI